MTQKLSFLDIAQVTEIPDSFKDMKLLKGLRLVGCDISHFPRELEDRMLYYEDEDVTQFEIETGKSAIIMGRETKKFILWLKKTHISN